MNGERPSLTCVLRGSHAGSLKFHSQFKCCFLGEAISYHRTGTSRSATALYVRPNHLSCTLVTYHPDENMSFLRAGIFICLADPASGQHLPQNPVWDRCSILTDLMYPKRGTELSGNQDTIGNRTNSVTPVV